jgi:hypothetical protein
MVLQGGAAVKQQTQTPDGSTLLLLSAVVSLQLAQGRSQEDLALMAAFFTVLGDSLALLALSAPESGE